MKKPVKQGQYFLTEYDDVEIDDSCGMKFWWSQKESGRGIVPTGKVVGDMMLAETKKDLRTVSLMSDISQGALEDMVDDILEPLSDADRKNTPKMELLYRRLGWMVAHTLFMEPDLRKRFDRIEVPESIVLDRDPLWVVTHPDRIMRNKIDAKHIIYREYVPTTPGMMMTKWRQSWHYNMRLHVGMASAQDEIKECITEGQIMGLGMGFISATSGTLHHPYVYGYKRPDGTWAQSYLSGEKSVETPIWEYPLGLVEWVKRCGKEVAESQFPLSPPVYLKHIMLDGWVARRLHRERELDNFTNVCHTNKHERRIHFEPRTSQCIPTLGDACPYLKACWDQQTNNMPMKEGVYMPNILQLVSIGEGVTQ